MSMYAQEKEDANPLASDRICSRTINSLLYGHMLFCKPSSLPFVDHPTVLCRPHAYFFLPEKRCSSIFSSIANLLLELTLYNLLPSWILIPIIGIAMIKQQVFESQIVIACTSCNTK